MRSRLNSTVRSQSAMEYLMTYGWSILIIAVVVAALFSLGVFNGGAGAGQSVCIASAGYQCTSAVLSTSGSLSATVGEIGQTITITSTGCTNSSASPTLQALSSSVTLGSAQSSSLTFSCPSSNLGTLGAKFSGYLWIKYNTASQSNVILRIGQVKLTVTSVAAGSSISYTHGGNTGSGTALSLTLASGASRYLCVGSVNSNIAVGPTWSADETDYIFSYLVSQIGGQSGNTCSATQGSSAAYAIAGVAVTGGTPSLQEGGNNGGVGSIPYYFTYTVGDTAQYTFILIGNGGGSLTPSITVTPSSGTCSWAEQQNSAGGGYAYIYVCSGQSAGTYTANLVVTGSQPPSYGDTYGVYTVG